jgi:tetratricopeptide (TPR) repeat protein
LVHDGKVEAVALSGDGRLVLTGSADTRARLWDADTGKLVQVLLHEDEVRAVALSNDGRLVLTGSADTRARLWKAASGELQQVFRHEKAVRAVALSGDGLIALTGSDDKTARLWEAATGKPGKVFRHQNAVRAVALSGNGRTVLTGSRDGKARLWGIVSPAPDDRERLRAWVATLTQKAFTDAAVLRELTPAEWEEYREQLQSRGGDWTAPSDARRWHLSQANDAEREGNWFGVSFHVGRLLAAEPGNAELRRRLADAQGHHHAELKQWDKAIPDFQDTVRLQPSDASAWYRLGLAYLGSGDRKAYQDHCRRMREHFSNTEDINSADHVTSLAVLLFDAVADVQPLVQLVEQAHRREPQNADYLETLGAVLYRAGRYPQAFARLNEAVARHDAPPPRPHPVRHQRRRAPGIAGCAGHSPGNSCSLPRWPSGVVEQGDRADEETGSECYLVGKNPKPLPASRSRGSATGAALTLVYREQNALPHLPSHPIPSERDRWEDLPTPPASCAVSPGKGDERRAHVSMHCLTADKAPLGGSRGCPRA